MRLCFFILKVTDIEMMKAWYRDIVGLKPVRESAGYKEFLTEDGFSFNLCKRNPDEIASAKTINQTVNIGFDFSTFQDLDATYDRLIQAGAIPLTPPTTAPWGDRMAYLADPEGNILCLNAMKE
jgi:uncharacterized glyoxalase superfamily protein PhnB